MGCGSTRIFYYICFIKENNNKTSDFKLYYRTTMSKLKFTGQSYILIKFPILKHHIFISIYRYIFEYRCCVIKIQFS